MHKIHMDLYYKAGWCDEVYKYPNQAYYEMESTNCEKYPNDIVKLMDVLTAFEAKNC